MTELTPEFRRSLDHERLDEPKTRDLVARAQAGDREAAGEIIIHNERLVYSVAKRFVVTTGENSLDDLMQEGRMGLLHAIKKFDLTRGVKFSTYALWWVQQRIKRYNRHAGHPLVMSEGMFDERSKATRSRETLLADKRHEPTVAEVAKHAGIRELAARSLAIRFFSLDDDRREDNYSANRSKKYQIDEGLTDGTSLDLEIDRRLLMNQVDRHLAHVNPKFREILRMYYGLDGNGPQSFEQISKKMHCSKQAVQNGRDVAVNYLRAMLSSTTLDEYADRT